MIRKFFKKKNTAMVSRAARIEKAAARLKALCPEIADKELLDIAFFDLDSENNYCSGIIAITATLILSSTEINGQNRLVKILINDIE